MRILSYGSNMSEQRLRARVPSARKISNALLPGYKLVINKKSITNSAKGNIIPTGNLKDEVYAVVWEIDENDKPALDAAEGLNNGYIEAEILAQLIDTGEMSLVKLYIASATHIDNTGLLPFDWYMAHIIRGAEENKLPSDYIAMIKAFPTKIDPDEKRAKNEFALGTTV